MVEVVPFVFRLTHPCSNISMCGHSVYSINDELLYPDKQAIL